MFDLAALSASFGGFIWMFFFFVIALSIIVAVHEYGHYIVGRWCGIHAEVFSVGFGTVLLSRVDRHGTRWQFAALPFGGFVRFKGDASAASAPDAVLLPKLSAQERRQTMHGAPIWARAATAAAGPVFNFILSIVLYGGLFMWHGQYDGSLKIAKLTPVPGEMGLQVGDEILAVAGQEVRSYEEFATIGQALVPPVRYTVLRDGGRSTVLGPMPFPALVAQVQPRSAAIEAGLQAGDVILRIDGRTISGFSELQRAVAAADGDEMGFSVWRAGREFDVRLTAKSVAIPSANGDFVNRRLVGISGGTFFEPDTDPLPFGVALAAATERTWSIISLSLAGLKQMILGSISACNISGPVAIAETAGQMARQGAMPFVALIAGLSAAVGLMNLFPIPVLDGGHLLFCAYEAITGRKPSDSALQILMTVGLVLVLSLTAFAVVMNFMCP